MTKLTNVYRRRLPGWVLLAVLAGAGPALAQMTIEGRVKTEDGGPLPEHIRVSLLGDMYQALKDTYVDPSGRFRFESASMTCYVRLEVGGTDYEVQTVRIDPNPNPYSKSAREVIYKDIVLKRRALAGKGSSGTPPAGAKEVFVQNVPREAQDAFARGTASLGKKDYTAAVESYKRAIEIFPDYYDALDALGAEQTREKNYPEAIALLHRAVNVYDNSWKAHYTLGVALVESQQREEGVKELRRAVELNPTSLNANMRLGIELGKDAKMAPEGAQILQKVTQRAGKEIPDAYFYLASIYNRLQQYSESADALEAYMAAVPKIEPAQRDQYRKVIQQLRLKAAKK